MLRSGGVCVCGRTETLLPPLPEVCPRLCRRPLARRLTGGKEDGPEPEERGLLGAAQSPPRVAAAAEGATVRAELPALPPPAAPWRCGVGGRRSGTPERWGPPRGGAGPPGAGGSPARGCGPLYRRSAAAAAAAPPPGAAPGAAAAAAARPRRGRVWGPWGGQSPRSRALEAERKHVPEACGDAEPSGGGGVCRSPLTVHPRKRHSGHAGPKKAFQRMRRDEGQRSHPRAPSTPALPGTPQGLEGSGEHARVPHARGCAHHPTQPLLEGAGGLQQQLTALLFCGTGQAEPGPRSRPQQPGCAALWPRAAPTPIPAAWTAAGTLCLLPPAVAVCGSTTVQSSAEWVLARPC